MANAYFQKFPTLAYSFPGQSNLQTVLNIIHRTKIADYVAENVFNYDSYMVKDGDTLWTIAGQYYGDTRYIYLLFLSNPNLIDPYYDWPMTYEQFVAFIDTNYGSVAFAQSTVHHYEDLDGDVIDQYSYNQLSPLARKSIDLYTYYYNLNESKRNITLIQPQYALQIDQELTSRLAGVQ